MKVVAVVAALTLLTGCGPDYFSRIDLPLSLSEAQGRVELAGFPLPATAKNIYYAGYADWQASEVIVRFDTTPEDCTKVVQEIVRWHEGAGADGLSTKYPTTTLSEAAPPPDLNYLAPTIWWDGPVSAQGLFAGGDCCGKPQVWADLDLGRVYYHTAN